MSVKSVFNFLIFFKIYFILFQTLLIDLVFDFFLSEFYWLFFQLIDSGRFSNAVSFPVWFSFFWDRHKIDDRTWISSQNVMSLTRGITTVGLHWFCLWFWKQLVYLGQSWLCDLVHISLQKCGLLWTQHILFRINVWNITITSTCSMCLLRAWLWEVKGNHSCSYIPLFIFWEEDVSGNL